MYRSPYFCTPINEREFSSVGLEHLPYKQRVGGSTPSTPTLQKQGFQFKLKPLFIFWFKHLAVFSL